MTLVENFLTIKNDYEEVKKLIDDRCSDILKHYQNEKAKVSTKPYHRWGELRYDGFILKGKFVKIHTMYYGKYGYSESKTLKLPIELVDCKKDEILEKILDIIYEEGIDIKRREKLLKDKNDSLLKEKELSELKRLKNKYEQ